MHDANLVFHVPALADDLFRDASVDPKAAKRLVMRHIARGPGRGARLVLVDFGQARPLGAVRGRRGNEESSIYTAPLYCSARA